MKTKSSLGILAVTLLIGLLLAIAATPASAANIYASGTETYYTSDGDSHYGAVFNIPHRALPYKTWENPNVLCSPVCARPYIGGVNLNVVNRFVSSNHKDVQAWDFAYRKQINSNTDKTVLMVPQSYVYPQSYYYYLLWGNTNFWKEMYLSNIIVWG